MAHFPSNTLCNTQWQYTILWLLVCNNVFAINIWITTVTSLILRLLSSQHPTAAYRMTQSLPAPHCCLSYYSAPFSNPLPLIYDPITFSTPLPLILWFSPFQHPTATYLMTQSLSAPHYHLSYDSFPFNTPLPLILWPNPFQHPMSRLICQTTHFMTHFLLVTPCNVALIL